MRRRGAGVRRPGCEGVRRGNVSSGRGEWMRREKTEKGLGREEGRAGGGDRSNGVSRGVIRRGRARYSFRDIS